MIWRLVVDNTNFMTGEIKGLAVISITDSANESRLSMLKQMQDQFGWDRVVSLVPADTKDL